MLLHPIYTCTTIKSLKGLSDHVNKTEWLFDLAASVSELIFLILAKWRKQKQEKWK